MSARESFWDLRPRLQRGWGVTVDSGNASSSFRFGWDPGPRLLGRRAKDAPWARGPRKRNREREREGERVTRRIANLVKGTD